MIKDASGQVIEIRCTYDPETRGGSAPDGRKVKGNIQWVSAQHAVEAEVRLYDRLFTVPAPASDPDYLQSLNTDSVEILQHCQLEPAMASADPDVRYQFGRQGYFCLDSVDSRPEKPVFNRIVTLRDSWAKMNK